MSKTYILFTEEELNDLRDGREIEYNPENGTALYFMSKEHYDSMNSVSEEDWKKAIEHLDMLIVMYACIGFAGTFGLNGVLVPLKKRYDSGERTKELYDEIMQCE